MDNADGFPNSQEMNGCHALRISTFLKLYGINKSDSWKTRHNSGRVELPQLHTTTIIFLLI